MKNLLVVFCVIASTLLCAGGDQLASSANLGGASSVGGNSKEAQQTIALVRSGRSGTHLSTTLIADENLEVVLEEKEEKEEKDKQEGNDHPLQVYLNSHSSNSFVQHSHSVRLSDKLYILQRVIRI